MREDRVTDLGHVFPLLVDFVVELMTLKVASCIHDRVFEVAGGFSTWRTFFFFLRLMSVTASRPLILFAALCFFLFCFGH